MRICTVCHCSDKKTCESDCQWVEGDVNLCTGCAAVIVCIREWIQSAVDPNLKRLMLAVVATGPKDGDQELFLLAMSDSLDDAAIDIDADFVVRVDSREQATWPKR